MNRALKFAFPILLLLQVAWHAFFWLSDFNALTTDEYLRLYFSASWAKYPKLFIPGEFLPFYFYVYGSAINLLGNIVWAGRVVTLGFSLLFMTSFFGLVKEAYGDKKTTILALVLVMGSPLYMRISTVPLSEIAALALISFSLFFLFRWLHQDASHPKSWDWNLAISMLGLAVGNAFRYECWVVSGICLAFVWFELFRRSPRFLSVLGAGLLSSLPALVMVLWLGIGKIYFENPTKFIPPTGGAMAEGFMVFLLQYPKFLLFFYPLLVLLLVVTLRQITRSWRDPKPRIILILSIAFTGFLAFISMKYGHHHVILPERTLLFLVLFLAPIISHGTLGLLKKYPKKFWRWACVSLLVLSFGWAHVSFGRLPTHPLLAAKQVGKSLRGQLKDGQNVLVEKTGWDWCAVYVESNLLGRIFFDRRSILGKKMTQDTSVLLTMSRSEMIDTFREGGVSHFVLKDPRLKAILEKNLQVTKRVDKGEFSVFSVTY